MASCESKTHYLSGESYSGKTHKMPNGECHTGTNHTKVSKKLTHSKPKKKKK